MNILIGLNSTIAVINGTLKKVLGKKEIYKFSYLFKARFKQ